MPCNYEGKERPPEVELDEKGTKIKYLKMGKTRSHES
jgi:hypothetical protein